MDRILPENSICNSVQHISQPDGPLLWNKLWPVVGAGPEPGGHVDSVGGGQLEVGHAGVQVDGEGIKEHLFCVLPELKHCRQDSVLSPWRRLRWIGRIVGCARPHARTPGLISRKSCSAATVSSKTSLARTSLKSSALSGHCTWVDEPPNGSTKSEHRAVLQDRRLHRPLPVHHHLGPGVARGDRHHSFRVRENTVAR